MSPQKGNSGKKCHETEPHYWKAWLWKAEQMALESPNSMVRTLGSRTNAEMKRSWFHRLLYLVEPYNSALGFCFYHLLSWTVCNSSFSKLPTITKAFHRLVLINQVAYFLLFFFFLQRTFTLPVRSAARHCPRSLRMFSFRNHPARGSMQAPLRVWEWQCADVSVHVGTDKNTPPFFKLLNIYRRPSVIFPPLPQFFF